MNPQSNLGVLAANNFVVVTRGDQVIIKVGNSEIKMGYFIAIKLAFRLMYKAKQAKRWAGDTSKVSEHIAHLTDWEDDQRADQAHRVATATVIPKNLRG